MTAYDRCRCRPGCLSRLTQDDVVLLLDEGYALREHVIADAYPAEQLALDVEATA